MFADNKYSRWYFNIIAAARIDESVTCGYTEKHHIIPRCLGGSNRAENLVRLTPRQHFVCHLLLTKMHDYKKLALALSKMMGGGKRYTPRSSRVYDLCRKRASEAMKGEGNPMYGVSVKYTEERRQKLITSFATSEAMARRNADPLWRKRIGDAQRLPPKPTVITSVETGKVLFSFGSLEDAASTLGCSIDNLLHAAKDHRPIGKRMKSLSEKCWVSINTQQDVTSRGG